MYCILGHETVQWYHHTHALSEYMFLMTIYIFLKYCILFIYHILIDYQLRLELDLKREVITAIHPNYQI